MPLVIPSSFREYKILGIDPGLNNVGVAEYEVDFKTNDINSIEAYTIVTDHLPEPEELDFMFHAERVFKLMKLRESFLHILQNVNPMAIGCEAPFFNRLRPTAYAPLVEVVNVLYQATLDFNPNIPFTVYPPLTVKKTIGAQATKNDTLKGKELVKQAISRNKKIMSVLRSDLNSLSEHAIDGIGVGYTEVQSRSIYYV